MITRYRCPAMGVETDALGTLCFLGFFFWSIRCVQCIITQDIPTKGKDQPGTQAVRCDMYCTFQVLYGYTAQTELRLAPKTSTIPLPHLLEHGVSLTVPLNRPDTLSNNFAGQINGIVRNVSVCCIKGAVFTKALHPFLQSTPIRDISVVQSLLSYPSYRI